MRHDHVARARALIGCRFRPQGRDSALGLDCVGLIATVFDIPPGEVPSDYLLRGDHRMKILAGMERRFRRIARPRRRVGDVLLLLAGPNQFHLAVQTADGIVHADAARGKVVELPGLVPWPLAAVFRRRVRERKAG